MDDASTKENLGKNTVNNLLDFRSPQHLLLEVILVDDASTKENLGKKLGKDALLHFFCLFFLKRGVHYKVLLQIKNCMIRLLLQN